MPRLSLTVRSFIVTFIQILTPDLIYYMKFELFKLTSSFNHYELVKNFNFKLKNFRIVQYKKIVKGKMNKISLSSKGRNYKNLLLNLLRNLSIN